MADVQLLQRWYVNIVSVVFISQKIMTIEEKIKQRRRQMLVHSYIYYELDQNIVSDTKWAEWAKELEKLQHDYPDESKRVEFYDMFQDWDGSSGAFLNFGENIKTVAKILLDYRHINSDFVQKPKIKSQKIKIKSDTRSLF